jgi:hypothetical protein
VIQIARLDDAPAYSLGQVSGSVDLHWSMGKRITCYINGDTTFNPVDGYGVVPDMTTVELAVQYSSVPNVNINFAGYVDVPTLDGWTLPFNVPTAYRQVIFTLKFSAAAWHLTDIEAFLNENTD